MDVTVKVGTEFRKIIKDLDPTRPISGAPSAEGGTSARLTRASRAGAWNGDVSGAVQWGEHVVDIGGINYNYGSFDPVHQQLPNQPMVRARCAVLVRARARAPLITRLPAQISSESCSCTSDRSAYINTSMGIIGPYNAWSCIRDCWKPIAARNFVMGSFDWCMSRLCAGVSVPRALTGASAGRALTTAARRRPPCGRRLARTSAFSTWPAS
jgi:hypothetical protein